MASTNLSPLATFRAAASPSPDAGGKRPTLIESYSAGGYLYLGLSNVSPPQGITLLAIVDDAPAADFAEELEPLVWYFLTSDGWSQQPGFPGDADGTYGFQKSG